MHHRWLGQLFAQCGTIRGVYIPSKKRVVSKSKFGFLRFKEGIAVEKAIRMFHEIWCMNNRLVVKHEKVSKRSARRSGLGQIQNHLPDEVQESMRHRPQEVRTVVAKTIDEEWLKSCVVGIVKDHIVPETVQNDLISDGILSIKSKFGAGMAEGRTVDPLEHDTGAPKGT
ncbi:hypothetical protein U1Q18_005934 [Sarracenia purpurea var. burkii]